MTKTSVFGQEAEPKKEKKQIIFVKELSDNEIKRVPAEPAHWNHVMLLRKSDHNMCYDIMYAYDTGRENGGLIYLGYWNDGVVD